MDGEPNHGGNSRRWVITEAENSLRRLQTDWIDLYQVHRPDPSVDLDETLGALTDLVHAGKVRAIGTSTFPAELLVESAYIAEHRGRERFSTEQPPYSIFARGIERDVLPVAERFNLGVLVWAPLNGGWLSGKYRRGSDAPSDSRALRQSDHFDWGKPEALRKLDLVEQLAELADGLGCPLPHLAIAFTLAHRGVTSAIAGPRTPAQLESMLGAESLELDSATLDRIDELVPARHQRKCGQRRLRSASAARSAAAAPLTRCESARSSRSWSPTRLNASRSPTVTSESKGRTASSVTARPATVSDVPMPGWSARPSRTPSRRSLSDRNW